MKPSRFEVVRNISDYFKGRLPEYIDDELAEIIKEVKERLAYEEKIRRAHSTRECNQCSGTGEFPDPSGKRMEKCPLCLGTKIIEGPPYCRGCSILVVGFHSCFNK